MKKFLSAALGLLVIGGVAYVGISMRQNDGKLPWENLVKPVSVKIPAGTQVPLILLEGLDAGGSKVGQKVRLAVSEDVKLGDHVVIFRGTEVSGEVTESRGASLMGAVGNRPARLAITLGELKLAGNKEISLKGDKGAVYTFTQASTADRADSAKLERLWEDSKSREALEKLSEDLKAGKNPAEQEAALKQFAEGLGLETTRELTEKPVEPGRNLTLGSALNALQRGDLAGLAGVDAVLAAQAVGEIADLASSVDHKLRGVFKGRTIRATIGTPLEVKTGETVTVEVLPELPKIGN